MSRVQSPEIGNALREVLALDGSGAFPLDAAGTIVPVAIVADVREQLDRSEVDAAGFGFVSPGVAAQYPYVQLEWNGLASAALAIRCRKIRIWSGTSQLIYVGLGPALAGAASALPRRKLGSLQAAPLAGRVIAGTNATAPLTLVPTFSQVVRNPAFELTLNYDAHPWELDLPQQALIVMGATVNTELFVAFDWDEEVRP